MATIALVAKELEVEIETAEPAQARKVTEMWVQKTWNTYSDVHQ